MENTSIKAPVLVTVISWFLLISGFLNFFRNVFGVGDFSLMGVLLIAISIVNIIVAVGLMKMKKWALYIFLATTLISLVVIFVQTGSTIITAYLPILIEILILVYFWTIRKRFV